MKRISADSMDFDRTELLGADTNSLDGSGRVWVESVSAGMRTVEAVIRELSQNDVPMLVVAERGSGKAAAAARIHALSSRAAEPFHVDQAGGVSVQTLAAREGQGGSVYLQEVGDLTAAAQKELVRQIGLQSAEQRRVPRFICGTSRELEPEVKAGKFREDLYYGISGVCLRLPPLRQRKEDIPVLRDWFLGRGPGFLPGRAGAEPRNPEFLPGIQLAGKHSRAERCRSSHCRAGR